MRKLKLDLDELRVDTFETARRKEPSGTVWGNMPFEMPVTDDAVCTGGGGSGDTCPCTQKYSCPNGCSDYCTATECPTYATGCCWP